MKQNVEIGRFYYLVCLVGTYYIYFLIIREDQCFPGTTGLPREAATSEK